MDNEIGKKYGKLTVISFSHQDKYYYNHYLCECECGNKKIISIHNLRGGKSKSCGCTRIEKNRQNFKKTNRYVEDEGFVIGYTTNKNSEFYIDKEDYDKIKDMTWIERNNGYISNTDGVLLHRFVTNCDKKKVVDHLNHNIKDNRKSNLRVCTQKENMLNRKDGPKGISEIKRVNGNTYYVVQLLGKYIGMYKTYEEELSKRNEIINAYY